MATAKICLIDFNRWMKANNDDLFSLLSLPEGIDKDTLVGNILLRGGEFECVYSDPSFIQNAIAIWSSKWYRTFDKWIKALNIEYSPLENYDRMEDWTDTRNKHDSATDGSSGSIGENGSFNNTGNSSDNSMTENKVSAFDSSDYQPSQQTTTEASNSNSNFGSDSRNTTTSNTLTHSGEEHEGNTHKGRIHGNVGVTTSQQMLISELELAEWNLYEHITDIFLSEFVIPIYS